MSAAGMDNIAAATITDQLVAAVAEAIGGRCGAVQATLDGLAHQPVLLLAWLIEAELLTEPDFGSRPVRADGDDWAHPEKPGCDEEPPCRHLYVWTGES